jgi:hypothetical protein
MSLFIIDPTFLGNTISDTRREILHVFYHTWMTFLFFQFLGLGWDHWVHLVCRPVQWHLVLRVTLSVSVLQEEQTFLTNFNLINEPCLAIRVLYYLYAFSAERHVITSRSGLWVIVSHARSQSSYLIRIVSIRASVVITCVGVKIFLFYVKM